MNRLDDFLKQKMDGEDPLTPSSWAALEKTLPAANSGGIAKWTFVTLIAGIAITALFYVSTNNASPKYSQNEQSRSVSKSLPEHASEKPVITSESTAAVKDIEPVNAAKPSNVPAVISSEKGTIREVNLGSDVLASVPEAAAYVKNRDHDSNIAPSKPQAAENEKNNIAAQPDPADAQEAAKQTTRKAPIHIPSKDDYQKGKLYAKVSFSPLFSYRTWQLTNGAAGYVHKQFRDIREASDKGIAGSSFGLSLEYRFKYNFSLETGVNYSFLGMSSRYEYEVTEQAQQDPGGSGRILGYNQLPSPVEVSAKGNLKFQSVRIPVLFNYNVMISTTSTFHLGIGGGINRITAMKGTVLDPVELSLKRTGLSDFNKTSKDVMVKFGFSFAAGSKWGFEVDAFYDRWINNISKSTHESTVPFTTGINLAFSRKLF
jgi:hypothetical protein